MYHLLHNRYTITTITTEAAAAAAATGEAVVAVVAAAAAAPITQWPHLRQEPCSARQPSVPSLLA